MKQVKKSKVAVLKCESYETAKVMQAVQKGIRLLGGITRFVKPNETILLKPNVLFGHHPDRCVTTHPALIEAAGIILKQAGCQVWYGDSSGFGDLRTQMKKSLLMEAADRFGLEMADFSRGRKVVFPRSPFIKEFTLANGVLEADGLISLPKMKTHGFMHITGAVKNQFGCIPGFLKPRWHVDLPNPYNFAKMLVCLNLVIKPRLYILDGVRAMEGNGPGGGDPVAMNAILVSDNPIALDSVFCRLINLDPSFVQTNLAGADLGLGDYQSDRIETVGDELEPLVNRNFKVNRKKITESFSEGRLSLFRKRVSRRPVIQKDQCIKCGICVESCPVIPKAVSFTDGHHRKIPQYNYERCIRCFCCQEMCPQKAIRIKTPFINKFIRLFLHS